MLEILVAVRDALFAVLMAWLGLDGTDAREEAANTHAADMPILQIDAVPAEDELDAYRS